MELAFTPSGHIVPARQIGPGEGPSGETGEDAADRQSARLAEALAANEGEGLFALATERTDGSLGPTYQYWRGFAARYLTALCHTPGTAAPELPPTSPPDAEQLAALVANVPPMQGAEYINDTTLVKVWNELDAWVRQQIAASGEGLAGFLKRRAPLWHQVGRVCFRLAENPRNPDEPFAFMATYTPSLSGGARVQYLPLSRALEEMAGKNNPALVRLLSPVHEAAKRSALVKRLEESGDIFHALVWTPAEAYVFLRDVPVFEESGLVVRLPDWWKKRPRPRVRVTIGDKRQKTFDASSMVDFNVQLALGDQELTEAEWRQLMSADDGLVLLRGQWVEVDREKLSQALDHWKRVESEAEGGLSFIEGMRLLAGVPADLAADPGDRDPERQWSFVDAGKWLGDVLAKMRSPDGLADVAGEVPLQATLRKYQETGVNWLWFLSSLGLGACLADDMGLGKTIQVLGLLLALKKQRRDKPSLLVLPASLLANWKAEIVRFAPSLRAVFVHPSETAKEQIDRLAADPVRGLQDVDVVATTYGMLLRQPWLVEHDWRLVVLDEAQAIKNPGARQTKLVKQLCGEARIALTGTPVENRLSDLWSLFDFLSPGLLGTAAKFKDFIKRLDARTENRYAPLRSLVQPYLLRRLKTDRRVIDDLPEKVEVRAYAGLSKRQASMYTKLVGELKDALEATEEGIRRRGLVLAYIMRFKQLCNHPSQLLGDGRFLPDDSGKFTRLAEICEEIASRQERALVFTQFREMTAPLADFLAQVFGRPGLVLHGATAVKQRKALVDQFQRDDGPPFFVVSLKAGGTGLNLTAASHVIHFDRWWNPAVENQATDRAFRIGQKRNVLVHKFVCRGTIEERIDALIEEKRLLAADLIEGGAEKMLTEMSDSELIRFVSLDVTRASD